MGDRRLDQAPGPTSRGAGPWLARAWVAVALIPVFFVIGFAVGEGVYALMGYRPENADAPVWAVVLASMVILVVVETPCVAAAYSGRRTRTSAPPARWTGGALGDGSAQERSNLSRFITLSQALTKSRTNFSWASSSAYTSEIPRSWEFEPKTRSTAVAVHLTSPLTRSRPS